MKKWPEQKPTFNNMDTGKKEENNVHIIHTRYFQLLAGFILLTQISLASCNQSIRPADEQQNQTVNEEYSAVHKEISGHIDELEKSAMELKNFKWRHLSDIGNQIYPNTCGTSLVRKNEARTTGGFRWISLVDMLPRAENATPILAYCDTCATMLDDMKMTASTADLQEQAKQLESILNGAENLVKNYLKTSHNQFIDIEEAIINSRGDIEQDYLTTFHTQAQAYLDLLENMLDTIKRAKEATATLGQSETG